MTSFNVEIAAILDPPFWISLKSFISLNILKIEVIWLQNINAL